MSEQLLSIREVSARSGLPLSWLYTQTAANAIPHLKLGKYVRFRESELQTWLDQHRRGPRPA